MDIETITFALPMFGNFALRDELQKRGEKDSRFAQMYHFVLQNDIVPSCSMLNWDYKNLSKSIKYGIFMAKMYATLQGKWKLVKKITTFDSKAQEAKAVDEVDFIFKKYDTLHEPTHIQPIFDKKDGNCFVPIGNYFYICSNRQDEECKMYDMEDEKIGPQFLAFFLVKSLHVLSEFGVNQSKDALKKVTTAHSLEESYIPKINQIFNMRKGQKRPTNVQIGEKEEKRRKVVSRSC